MKFICCIGFLLLSSCVAVTGVESGNTRSDDSRIESERLRNRGNRSGTGNLDDNLVQHPDKQGVLVYDHSISR